MTPDEIGGILEHAGFAESYRMYELEMERLEVAKGKLRAIVLTVLLAALAIIPLSIGLMFAIIDRCKA